MFGGMDGGFGGMGGIDPSVLFNMMNGGGFQFGGAGGAGQRRRAGAQDYPGGFPF